MTVRDLDALPAERARELLAACCGAEPWVEAMLAARPYRSLAGALAAAGRAWAALSPESLAQVIERHPRLGESRARAALSARERAWSAAEQSGAATGDGEAIEALARGNEEYERRFGHTFILCASGLSAAEMLRSLRERLAHDVETERSTTARELERIVRLRLGKLLTEA